MIINSDQDKYDYQVSLNKATLAIIEETKRDY